ncbi:protein transport protein Sec61 subunit beta-like [Miscanthus floridulus]|uniref:protein transport protein Sec61 subunit beta-like n=1 Tax=Miscanthus floridulus TaxID=154761 RepID=UPI0034583D2B
MARSSSQSQTSIGGADAGAHPVTIGPRSMAAAAVGMHCRLTTTSSRGGGRRSTMLYFYTDEAPVLRLSPSMVLVTSLCFISFVTALHIFSKLYRSRTATTSV